MSDMSLDDLHASVDVVWDFGVSADLAARLDAAAVSVEGQVGPRSSRKLMYGAKFCGYYAQLWAYNVETANRDAVLLAGALRNVARGVRVLEADARVEQARIDAAREWKRARDARSWWQEAGETVDFLHLFHEDVLAPKADPVVQMEKRYEASSRGERKRFEGTSECDTTSALPDDLRGFVSQERAANDSIRSMSATLAGLLADFRAKCRWGQLGADGVIGAFKDYVSSNDDDCARVEIVASAFEAAGGSGVVSTVANSAIRAALAACGVGGQRPELEVPAVQAIGNPPSSGYSDDPVNTATGNFVENEEDLRFWGASGLLGWARSYSSQNAASGGHGSGWASARFRSRAWSSWGLGWWTVRPGRF